MTNQEVINRSELARQILDNPVHQQAFTQVRAALFESLGKVKKGRGYEQELKDIHDTMQNLDRLERIIKSAYTDGKVILDKKNRLARFVG